jgi:hypothetical protein
MPNSRGMGCVTCRDVMALTCTFPFVDSVVKDIAPKQLLDRLHSNFCVKRVLPGGETHKKNSMKIRAVL